METLLSDISTLFSWFIDYSIDISIFICLVFIIKSIASKRLPAWWHYSLWLVLLIRMIMPWKYEKQFTIPDIMHLPMNIKFLESALLEKKAMVSSITTGATSNMQGLNISFDEALLFIWLTGAIILGVYILIKNIRFWFTIKEKPILIDKEVLDLLEESKRRMKINSVIGIVITDTVKSPALFGYLRPRLLLPVGVLEKLSKSELVYVFMHELGHLKRHDIGVSWLITFLQIFHWFNPLVWLAFYQMRIDQETACDASVLSKIKHNQSKDYAGTIIGFLEKFCQNRQLPAMAGIIENKSQIKRRIAMIVKYKKHSKKITAISIVMLIFTGLIFYTLTGFAQENNSQLTKEAQHAMVEAQKYFPKNDFASARKPLLDYIATNPEVISEQVYLLLGFCWHSDGNSEEALQVFEEGYEAYPDNFDLVSYYAATLYETEYYTEAAPMMEKVYEKDEKKRIRYLEAAMGAYYQSGNLDDTKRVLINMIDLPGDPKPNWINMLYKIAMEQGDMNEAKYVLEMYINKVENPDPKFLSMLNQINNSQENTDEALKMDTSVASPNLSQPQTESESVK